MTKFRAIILDHHVEYLFAASVEIRTYMWIDLRRSVPEMRYMLAASVSDAAHRVSRFCEIPLEEIRQMT